MGKQAMGVYVTNYDSRMDKTAYVHTYGMRPLVDTRLMNIINLHTIPSGAQVIVAIMTHTGYNQEDSIYLIKVLLNVDYFKQLFIIQKRMKIKRFTVIKKYVVDQIQQKLNV